MTAPASSPQALQRSMSWGCPIRCRVTSTFLTDGCARRIRIGSRTLEFKRGVPRNFIYRTDLAACLVQALKAIGKGQAGSVDLGRIAELIEKEPNKDSFFSDLRLAPVWMRRLLMPIIRKYRKKADSPVTQHPDEGAL